MRKNIRKYSDVLKLWGRTVNTIVRYSSYGGEDLIIKELSSPLAGPD